MTKDNWIKAFEKLWETDEDNGGWYSPGNGGERHFYKVQDFISQVEKDAIEKTNKRWREELLAWYPVSRKKSVPWHDEQNKYRRRLVKNIKRVSDLLEDK